MAREINLSERLNPASYKGIPFLVPDESADRGQKIALHEYPNSDKRFAEPLGKIPPLLDLTGIVHGEFYFENRQNLERVLEEPGVGELVHPIYGPITVQPGKFTVKSSQRKIGEFIFTMKFYASEDVQPTPLPSTKRTAEYAMEVAIGSILDGLEDAYQEPIDSNALISAVDTVESALDSVNNAIDSVVDPIEDFAAATKTTIAKFRNGVYNIMQTAAGLKANLTDTYNSFLQLSSDIGTLSAAWDNLIDFSTPDSPDATTAQRANRANNQTVIKDQSNLVGLVGGFASAANTDFNTTDELQERVDFLESQFNRFIEDSEGILANDPTIRSSIINVRIISKAALDQQKSNIWKVIETDQEKTSMALITYRNYGSLDNIGDLISLNPEINNANFNEKISVVTK